MCAEPAEPWPRCHHRELCESPTGWFLPYLFDTENSGHAEEDPPGDTADSVGEWPGGSHSVVTEDFANDAGGSDFRFSQRRKYLANKSDAAPPGTTRRLWFKAGRRQAASLRRGFLRLQSNERGDNECHQQGKTNISTTFHPHFLQRKWLWQRYPS